MGKIPDTKEKEAYVAKAKQYVRKEYGDAFEREYNSFLQEYSGDQALIRDLCKNESDFMIKMLVVDFVESIKKEADNYARKEEKPTSPGDSQVGSTGENNSQLAGNRKKQPEAKKKEIDYKQQYRQSALLDNPFNLLNTKCNASRSEIAQAVEEMDFVLGSEKCSAAQGILVNPIKRLTAEMDWFPDAGDLLANSLRSYINENLIIPLSAMGPVSTLNALLNNFAISNVTDEDGLYDQIKQISESFTIITAQDTLNLINSIHEKAKIGQISVLDIEKDINRKRDEIRRLLSGFLQGLPDEKYVQIITRLSESVNVEEIESDVIITELVDQYEIWVQTTLQSKKDGIIRTINRIKKEADSEDRARTMISGLLLEIEEWQRYAYPLELRVGQTGMDNSGISDMAYTIRGLVIFLNNEKHFTNSAAYLTSEMKQMFAQLPEVLNKLNQDDEALRSIQKQKEEEERQEAEHRQADKAYSVTITGSKYAVPPYCTCCMKETRQTEKITFSYKTYRGRTTTTHTTSVNMPLCPECQDHKAKHKRLVIVLQSISACIGILAAIAVFIFLRSRNTLPYFTGALFAVCALFIILALKKTKPLPAEHSSRTQSVMIFNTASLMQGIGSSSIIFTFTNWKYAKLFQNANRDHVVKTVEINEINSAKRTSCLAIQKKKMGAAFLTLIIFTALYGCVLWLNKDGYLVNMYPDSPLAVSSGSVDKSSGTTKQSGSTTKKPASSNTAKPTSNKSTEETLYTSASSVGDLVYVDIVSIFPSWSIYTEKRVTYSGFVCECKTSDNKTVWTYFTAAQYKENIDSSISTFKSSSNKANTMEYSPVARIHGKVKRANTITATIEKSINSDKVIEYISIDIPEQEKDKLVMYAIRTIEPVYTITSGNESSYHHVICKLDYLGETKWLYISVTDYNKYFDSKRTDKTTVSFEEKEFDSSKFVFGRMKDADTLANGLAKEIGEAEVMVVESVK